MDPLMVGIVGTGIMARTHAAVLAAYHRSAIGGWATRDASRATDLSQFGPAPLFPDAATLARHPGVDAVLVATPDHLHAEAALAAIEAGKHVLIEKPLATTAADARRIRDAAAAQDVTAMTLFNHRWVPAYWQAKEHTADRRHGRPVLAYARKNDTRYVPTTMISWAARTTPSFFLSSHDLDLLLWYFDDRVVEVYATAVHGVLRGLGVDTPDAVQAQIRFAGGAVATLEACWTYPDTFPTMTDSFVELVFEGAVLHLDRKREQLELATEESYSFPRNQLAGRVGGRPSGSVAAAVAHFVDAVLDGTSPLVTLDSSVHVTEVLVAIDESWRSGRPVTVDQEG
ncbi:Gfo/Idh/MocA family protein [Micromonospora cathayae]|uniref:Gfo/Idh/MocA family oxidoreductase n=1 Tax=Micromonospora cathayae TaxID=3028804 RepID=A0ABY7ZKN5_9ACTN|nr:Gfo/Idh/MocA family oxidoreductase [Micromonospora sp. HUAS 3]WDZ82658.1 Gfo/Idh/MocA family oxidoreductase [Micromonospora sp. HUAS 3]